MSGSILRLPDVEVSIQNGEKVNLAKKYKKGILVLFSYPKANTGGCTRQTSGFGALYPEFKKAGAAVYGISADSLHSQTSFKNKTEIGFDLISDPNYEVIGPLHAKKQPKGIIRSHWVFLDGVAELEAHQVKPDASPTDALTEVKKLVAAKKGVKKEATDTKKELKKELKKEPKKEPKKESKSVPKKESKEPKSAKRAKPAESKEPERKRPMRSTRTPFTKV